LGGTVWAGVSQPYRSDHVLATTGLELNDRDGDGISLGFSSSHPTGVHFLFLDGHVRFISDNIDNSNFSPFGTYQWLSTINRREPIGEF
jgi:prepilin-type processing-associated H-X9-DG protein